MIALVAAVFVASLLGSLHCAGMCGGFLAFAVGTPGTNAPSRSRLQAAYHLGRLSTYSVLGAAAGTLGAAVDLGGTALGLQRAAAAIAGAMMVVFGGIALLRLGGVQVPRAPLPGFLRNAVARGHRLAFNLSATHRALAVGMLTTLLPCGWLYAFAITAAGTGSPLWGTLTMMVFWAGTLPVLVALGSGLQAISGALGRRLPVVTSLALVIVGLMTLSGRLGMGVLDGRGLFADRAGNASITRVNTLDWAGQPCCAPATPEANR